jgi:8-hydroxy-5-deazaflavin:NADPH oxidoreductase
MDVTIIGTGNMARGIGARLVAGGHDVTVLGKEPGDAEAVVKELAGARV